MRALDQHRVMHSDIVQRAQIYLDDEESALLARTSARTGASRSELIRRAVRTQYGGETPESRLAALQASAGAWRIAGAQAPITSTKCSAA
jgi:hypothetical protein